MTAFARAGDPVAIAIDTDVGAAFVSASGVQFVDGADALAAIARLDADVAPRWVWWPSDTARTLADAGIRPAKCWDLAAVHRLVVGGWRAGADRVWASAHGLDASATPAQAPVDLFTVLDDDDPSVPVRPDGYLRPDWVDGHWRTSPETLRAWAELALDTQRRQAEQLRALDGHPAIVTAHSESAAEMLCAELAHDGLPIDVAVAEAIIASFIGPRPMSAADEQRGLEERDDVVLRHLPDGHRIDLRNPANVKSLLRRVGIEVPDTRAWRLEQLRDEHEVVDALLRWRKAERIATTFGYRWLDEHVGSDGRLHGDWSGSDGAAGRMTATAGLHNMPADLRPAIVAEHGHVFVRADLGQIEPRVLAAVSGDAALAVATHDADMYAPVAARLGVERDVAKVAVLGAMYGQTTGHGAAALRGLESAYPVAMEYLQRADVAAQGGHDLRTRGGRLVRMSGGVPAGDGASGSVADRDTRSRAAARGRYGRNAMVQGAAAEFFKTWSVIVRARGAAIGARIVLCLHDEILLHVPAGAGEAAASIVDDGLQEAAHRWLPRHDGPTVRFTADTAIITRWSDAK